MNYNSIVIHYSEIGIKGKNREFFEKKLIENIKICLSGLVKNVNWMYGRISCDISEEQNNSIEKIKEILGNIPGIASFLFAKNVKLDMDIIKSTSIEIAEESFKYFYEKKIKEYSNKKINDKSNKNLNENLKDISFKISTTRSNKHFEKKSTEINLEVADAVYEKFNNIYNLTVNLKKPDVCISLEICEKNAFIFSEKSLGVGGLPVGTSGKIISSLSGGIDSPVSSFMMMKRGCKIVFVHAFNKTISGDGVKSKLIDLVKQLTKFQLHSKLYIVPFAEIQKKVISNIPARYRMIVYRRFMFKIINNIAKKEHAKSIVTGDSVGQVASQTIDNITCIYEAAKYPIFNPLIGMNKEEIMKLAEKIGTYNISIIPYPDCCSFMNAKSPETNAYLKDILDMEKTIGTKEDEEELLKQCVENSEILTFNFLNGNSIKNINN